MPDASDFSSPAMTDSPWTLVCALDHIVPNTGVCAKVGAHQVAVFRLVSPSGAESLRAIGNHDPKSGANVLSRGLVGDLNGIEVVASPIYKNHFDLATGVCLEEEGMAVPVYAVRVEAGEVFVKPGP